MPLVKPKKNLVRCHLIHKKSGLQSLQISSTFKFNFIFTLLPYGETLLIANSIHVSLISHWFTNAVECMWHKTTTIQTHHNNFRLTLSNFFGECEEIQDKLHSIVLTLLQWICAMSVGPKLTNFKWLTFDANYF